MSSLVEKNCKELRDMAKELNISGRWDMSKSQLIESIESAQKKDQEEVETNEEKNGNDCTDVHEHRNTGDYIENVSVGTLVAFKLHNGKVKSAKVERKSTKRRALKVVTEYGAEYIIGFDDVLWVRTGKRWPRGVYNLLKGVTANGAREAAAM